MAKVHDFVRYKGADEDIPLAFADNSGTPINIGEYSIRLTIKTNPSDSDDDAVLQKDAAITDAANGKARFNITDTDTSGLEGTYYYDIRYKDASDNIKTLLTGKFLFSQGITASMS